MLILRDMTADEILAYRPVICEGLAQDVHRNYGRPIAEARMFAEHQFAASLPHGLPVPGRFLQHLTLVQDGREQVIGNLCYTINADFGLCTIDDLEVQPAFRGQGWARRALVALEARMRESGLRMILLNVFADNAVAQGLYRSQGFIPASIQMFKPLAAVGEAGSGEVRAAGGHATG